MNEIIFTDEVYRDIAEKWVAQYPIPLDIHDDSITVNLVDGYYDDIDWYDFIAGYGEERWPKLDSDIIIDYVDVAKVIKAICAIIKERI